MKLRCLIATLALAPLCACGGGPEPAPPAPRIVLVVIDTLRADHLPFYGYARDTAPFLSALASEAVVFDNAFSTSSWTAPATASLFTSLDPEQHGVVTGRSVGRRLRERDPTLELNRIADELETLPEVLKRAGYATHGVVDNFNVSAELGFAQGFDSLDSAWYRGAAEINRLLEGQKEALDASERSFLYLHYIDPHHPYNGRDPWYEASEDPKRDAVARYDSEIRYVDERLREAYERFGWAEDTLLVVTSDHGEEFWDHGRPGHDKTLYDEVLRVPLLVRLPGGAAGGRRVAEPVGLIDVLPTLREYLGLPAAAADLGVSLMGHIDPARRGRLPARALSAHLVKKRPHGKTPRIDQRAWLQGPWKLIRHARGPRQLFHLAKDPGEQEDLARHETERTAHLEGELAAFVAGLERHRHEAIRIDLTKEEREMLEALGYVE